MIYIYTYIYIYNVNLIAINGGLRVKILDIFNQRFTPSQHVATPWPIYCTAIMCLFEMVTFYSKGFFFPEGVWQNMVIYVCFSMISH